MQHILWTCITRHNTSKISYKHHVGRISALNLQRTTYVFRKPWSDMIEETILTTYGAGSLQKNVNACEEQMK